MAGVERAGGLVPLIVERRRAAGGDGERDRAAGVDRLRGGGLHGDAHRRAARVAGCTITDAVAVTLPQVFETRTQ